MTFERTTLEERLKRLQEIRRNLELVGSTDKADFVTDFHHYWLAERGLQLGAEVVLEIGHNILAAFFNRIPKRTKSRSVQCKSAASSHSGCMTS